MSDRRGSRRSATGPATRRGRRDLHPDVAVGLRDGDLDHAEQGAVPALAHELRVDPEPSGGAGALGEGMKVGHCAVILPDGAAALKPGRSARRAGAPDRTGRPARPATAPRPARRADAGHQLAADLRRRLAERDAVGQRHRTVALGQPRAVLAEHERHVGVGQRPRPEQPPEEDLAGRALGEIGPADDLLDALGVVVDDHGEVVGGGPVVAPDDQVVDDLLDRPEQAVDEVDPRGAGAQPQGRRAPFALALGALGRGERSAGSGVGALGQRAVRRRRRLAHLAAGAETGIEQAFRVEIAVAPAYASSRSDCVTTGGSQSTPSAARSASCCSASPGRTRPRSRSSTRIRNAEPALRAKSQASSAVRRLPRCSVPVGEGAYRPITPATVPSPQP
jgi:hypothetical protein